MSIYAIGTGEPLKKKPHHSCKILVSYRIVSFVIVKHSHLSLIQIVQLNSPTPKLCMDKIMNTMHSFSYFSNES